MKNMLRVCKTTFVTLVAIMMIHLFAFDVSANRDGAYCRGSQGYVYAVATDYSCTARGLPGDPNCPYTGNHYPGSPKACSQGSTVSIHHFTRACPVCAQPCSPSWGGWSACDASCDGGTQSRTQTCTGTTQSRACNTHACCTPVWGEWGNCTKTCGGGVQTRSQTCTGATEQRSCNTHNCPINGNCAGNYQLPGSCTTIENVISGSTAGLCVSGVFTGFTGSGTSASPWKWNCNGQYGGSDESCCAQITKGRCFGSGTATFNYPTSAWPGGFRFCEPSSANPNPNPVPFPQLTGSAPTTVTESWTCSTVNGTDGNTCSARLTPPSVSCGSSSSATSVLDKAPVNNLCTSTSGGFSVDPPVSFGTNGKWSWGCVHGVYAGITATGCEAPSCLAGNPLNVQNNVYFDGDGNPRNAKVTINCPSGPDICCEIDGNVDDGDDTDQDDFICTGDSGEIEVPAGGSSYNSRCWFKDDPGIEVPHNFSIGTMCTSRSCNAQGTCQATPQASATGDSCQSTCNSNADCSRGRMIETRP